MGHSAGTCDLLLSQLKPGEPEVFASVQGEGASMGTPSTFARLAVCNLRCTWCDTAYTWDWSRFRRDEQILPMDQSELLARVAAFAPRNVVITGGEPLIQRRALEPFARELKDRGYRLEVETNGTIAPGPLAHLVDQWNISPKLAHSGNEGLARIRPAVLREFAALPGAWFKFVVRDEPDLAEVRTILAEAGIPASRAVLMPEGRKAAELAARSPWLADACTREGYRFSTRLHILIWGDKRGV